MTAVATVQVVKARGLGRPPPVLQDVKDARQSAWKNRANVA